MTNDIEKDVMRKFKCHMAVSNFKKEIEGGTITVKEQKSILIKKVVTTACASIILIGGVTFATNFENVKEYISRYVNSRGIGNGIDSAVENGYIQATQMDYMKTDAKLSNKTEKIAYDIEVEAKVENFVMDDTNISIEFSFKFDNNISKYVNFDNIDIMVEDLIIIDEKNQILSTGLDYEAFKSYCRKNNLSDENYINCGLNTFPSYRNKEENVIRLMNNIYSDGFPKSKKLHLSFSKIVLTEENSKEEITITGNWKIDLDVPEKMYNRKAESYKVVSCSNDNFKVYSCKVLETGFEIGCIIDNLEKPINPRTIEEYKDKDFSKSPYVEMLNEYWEKRQGVRIRSLSKEKKDVSYVENSAGKKFICTMSPSRKQKAEWIEKDKCDFYETFEMTKYEATDNIKVILMLR